ncbi:hypothetical protein B0H14DRAFT_3168022 [Mycena olivaceomarginata]|nr:hypothetical protein B0H14DRAFT_3168022 [Mycena olivaceomarginata]
MTAAAICIRCGVFACVYPPLFFPHDTTTTLMPPTTTNRDCEGRGELDGDFGRMWWFGGAEQGVLALLFPRSGTEAGSLTPAPRSPECEMPRLPPAVACERAEPSHRRPIRSRGAISTGAAALWCSGLKIACGTWRVADSRKMQASCACESAGLNYVVQTVGRAIEFNFNATVFSYYGLVYAFAPSNTAANDFFDPRMTEWVKEDGGCNVSYLRRGTIHSQQMHRV